MKKDWEIKKLKDICRVINGRAYSEDEFFKTGKYKVLRVGNFFTNNTWYYSNLELDEDKYCVDGDLLYAWSASFGPKIWHGEKVIYHYHIWKLETNPCLDKTFFYWWLQSSNMINQFSSDLHGATMHHITKNLMESLAVPLPPLEEQKRIVKILDEKFAQLETIKANAQTNLQNAKDLFQSQLTKAFSNTTWEKKKFSELFKLSSGDYLNSKSIIKGKYPIYGGNGIIDYHKEYNLTGDNIIIGRVGALCGNVRYISDPIWLTDNAFKLTFIDFKYDYVFITYLLNHINLRSFARQAAQPVISNSSLKEIEIPLPPLPEQKRIVKELDTLSEKVRQLQEIYTKQIANCDELKQSYLQKAFEGEL